MVTLQNIKELLKINNPIKKSRVYGFNKINYYRLLSEVTIQLSNGVIITIPKGFEWDLASVPRFFWSICAPDNDAEIAYLIHDYLYESRLFSREECDKEMYKWAKITNGTNNISIKNIDNKLRYLIVKLFGKSAYEKD